MNNIAIITVYNKEDLFLQMKESVNNCFSLENLSVQIVGMKNTNNDSFTSAAQAYNHAIMNACDAEVYIFCHQDILFNRNALMDIYSLCMAEPQTLFGAAGVQNFGHGGTDRVISRMSVMQDGWRYKTLAPGTSETVFALDECMIAANRCVFEQIEFDEEACDGWHLYAADLCMQCHVKNIPVKVYDADIVHLSGGNADQSFYDCEKKLAKKYRKHFPIISYTFGWTYTDPIRYTLLHLYRKMRYRI